MLLLHRKFKFTILFSNFSFIPLHKILLSSYKTNKKNIFVSQVFNLSNIFWAWTKKQIFIIWRFDKLHGEPLKEILKFIKSDKKWYIKNFRDNCLIWKEMISSDIFTYTPTYTVIAKILLYCNLSKIANNSEYWDKN